MRRGRAVRATAALLAAAAALCGGCCSSGLVDELRQRWAAGDPAGAEAAADELLVCETGVDRALLSDPRALYREPALSEDDACLFLLEKGMARLAQGDADGAIDLFRRARDELDRRFVRDLGADILDSAGALLLDDAARDYRGADSDHVLVRVLLALSDLVSGGGDALAYAYQIGAKQEEILGAAFGVDVDYNPRARYRRIALGAYLEGVLREAGLAFDEAEKAYARALAYGGANPLVERAMERARGGAHSAPGKGVVHVFRLVGRGPVLVSSTHAPTELATRIAGVLVTLLSKQGAALAQAPVPVPAVAVRDPSPASTTVRASGGVAAQLFPILDVNAVVRQQLEANLPWIMARAVARRALKALGAAAVETAARQHGNNDDMATLVGALVNLVATGTERADTRCWSTLPAQVQAARLEAPAGPVRLTIGGSVVDLQVTAGHDSYVLVVEPVPGRPLQVLVDPASRAAAAPAPQP